MKRHNAAPQFKENDQHTDTSCATRFKFFIHAITSLILIV